MPKTTAGRKFNIETMLRTPRVQAAIHRAEVRYFEDMEDAEIRRFAAELSLPRAQEAWLREFLNRPKGDSPT